MTNIDRKIIDVLKEDIDGIIAEQHIPGLAISLVDEKDILWTDCFGYSNLETKTKVNPETIFNIQSIGKVFTAVGFMCAMTQGSISLEDKLLDYYPDFTVNSRYGNPEVEKLTFRHLLSHYGGFTHRTKIGGEYDQSTPSFEEYIKSIPDTWLRYPVGDRFFYSNLGMSLTAYCLSKVSGLSFPEFIQKEICDPLGITTLAYGKEASLRNPNRAVGYTSGREAEYSNIIYYGAGVQFLSVMDMSKFVQFMINEGKIMGKQHISKEYIQEMAKEQFTTSDSKQYYGLGLIVDKESIPNAEILQHSGEGCGYNAYITWNVKYKVGVIILTNNHPTNGIPVLGNKALQLLLKARGASISPPEKITPETFITKPKTKVDIQDLKKLEGYYAFPGAKFEFKIIEDKPIGFYQGNPIPLFSHSEIEFTTPVPMAIKFILDIEQNPTGADVLVASGEVYRFEYQYKPEEVEAKGPNRTHWKKYEGIFETTYLGDPVYSAIRLDNGHLKILFDNQEETLKEFNKNTFFTFDGRAAIFEKDLFYYDNIRLTRMLNPTEYVSKLCNSNPEHHYLSKNKLEELYSNLKYLQRDNEMKKITEIIQKLYPEEK